ncbi:MAG: alpha/beta hydrolase [Acidimicrobiales bacterium]
MDSLTLQSAGVAQNGAVELAWEQWGAGGAPLLLVNGLGSPMVSYELGFIALLVDAGFAVVRFDNRDTGRSTRCEGVRYDLGDMAADALAVLDAVGWDTAHVLGQSMGGMIVQTLAIEAPERLRSVTSFMSATGNPAFGAPSGDALGALTEVPPLDRDGWIESRLRTEKFWSSAVIDDPTWNRRKAELLYDYGIDTAGTGRQYNAVRASGDREAGLREVDLPFLVLHGSVDGLINPTGGQRTAELVPGARYVEINGMGHDLPPNFWPSIADEVIGFVRSVSDDLR